MGALTSLLVLASLLASIEENLPKTSYFKKIDVWFMGYIIFIFVIIVFHICVDFCTGSRGGECGSVVNGEVVENNVNVGDGESKAPPVAACKKKASSASYLNNWGKVVFPIVLIVFTVLYFVLSLI